VLDFHIALRSLLALGALWFVAYYLWRDYRHDSFREDMFSLRDELFLYAANGHIPFDHPAYTILRDRINALLRHGHDLTLTRLTLLLLIVRDSKSELTTRWEGAVAQLPVDTKEVMERFDVRVAIYVFQHVVYYSLFRYLLVRPLTFSIKVDDVIERPKVASGIQKLESETLAQEERELCRAATA
jgi:hypothetical protein